MHRGAAYSCVMTQSTRPHVSKVTSNDDVL
jgi:hypothetical protein